MPNPTAMVATATTAAAEAASRVARTQRTGSPPFRAAARTRSRWRRRHVVDERERHRSFTQGIELTGTAIAVREMGLEARALGCVQHVQRVEGGKLVKVVGHGDPGSIRPRPPCGSAPRPSAAGALESTRSAVLDVVRGRVLVRQSIHDVHPLAIGPCVDERLPFLGQSVLGEDRLDGALWLAGRSRCIPRASITSTQAASWDAVDGHVELVDVDARLGDHVRHGGLLYRRQQAVKSVPWCARRALISPPLGRSRRSVRGADPRCRCGSCSREWARPDSSPAPFDARDVSDHEIWWFDSAPRSLGNGAPAARPRAFPG